MLDAGLRALGCTVIPGGVGNSAAQVEVACAAGATGYAGTPQFLLTLLERTRETGREVPFRRALVTGAPLPPPLRARLQDEFGVDVFQSYGTADAGTLGYECEVKDGWHVAPGIVIELLVPGDDRPAAEGETGQVVVTSPNATFTRWFGSGRGDLSAWNREPCACGRTSSRLVGFLGRVGEGVKVKGMFVHPRELAGALAGDPMVARYVAVGDGGGRGRGRVHRAGGDLAGVWVGGRGGGRAGGPDSRGGEGAAGGGGGGGGWVIAGEVWRWWWMGGVGVAERNVNVTLSRVPVGHRLLILLQYNCESYCMIVAFSAAPPYSEERHPSPVPLSLH